MVETATSALRASLCPAAVIGVTHGSGRPRPQPGREFPAASVGRLQRLRVSENRRFLVRQDVPPFFWLGDTARELFNRLDRHQVERYFECRAGHGYTVVQAVALAESNGRTAASADGRLPLIDVDPARPAVQDGSANDSWDHVDDIVDRANALGLGPVLARRNLGRQTALCPAHASSG